MKIPFYYVEKEAETLNDYSFEFFRIDFHRHCVNIDCHLHPAAEILFMISGQTRLTVDDTVQTVSPGEIALIRSNTVHEAVTDGCSYYVMKIHPSLILSTFSGKDDQTALQWYLVGNHEEPFVFPASKTVCGLMELMISRNQEPNTQTPFFLRSCIGALAAEIAGEFARVRTRAKKRYIPLIYSGIQFLCENYNRDISPEECAAKAGMSYSNYARCFREVTGKSFKEYLIGYRMTVARKMLLTSTWPIFRVAEECGYHDAAYFSKEFRKFNGQTPREVRAYRTRNNRSSESHI